MALLDKYFDVDFQRGPSAFENTFGTYLGILLKENKERRKMEIKAADPTEDIKTFRELIKRKSDLLKEIGSLRGSSSGGGSITTGGRSGAADAAKAQLGLVDENREAQGNFFAGMGGAERFTPDIKAFEDFEDKPGEVASRTNDLLKDIETQLKSSVAGTSAGKHGIGRGILLKMEKEGIDQSKINEAQAVLVEKKYLPSSADEKRYYNPELLTEMQEDLIGDIRAGTGMSRKTVKIGGGGADPNAIAKLLMNELASLNTAIESQGDAVRRSQADYRRLISGTDRNLALAPIASRPSGLSRALEVYGQTRQTSPGYAQEMMRASREAGELTVPDRFRSLKTLPTSGGVSPIDMVLDTSDSLAILRGRKTIGPDGKPVESMAPQLNRLTEQDVSLVRGSLERMSKALKSPMFGKQNYGDVDFGGRRMEFNQFVEEVLAGFDDPRLPSNKKVEFAETVSDAMIKWSSDQKLDPRKQKMLQAARRDNNSGSYVSRSIGKIQRAKMDFDKTGDSKKFRQTLADEYNVINQTDREIRGDIGDAFLKQVDEFMATPEISRDASFLSNQMDDLKMAADEISIQNQPIELEA